MLLLIAVLITLTLLMTACGLLPGGPGTETPAAGETQPAASPEATGETPAVSATKSEAATHVPPAPGEPLQDTAGLLAALQAAGAQAAIQGEISQTFFPVGGGLVRVDEERLQAYEFPGAAEAGAQAARISPDGGQIGETLVEWIAAPRFYRSGRLIVLYIGGDAGTIDLLERLLGPPFAGAGSPALQTTGAPEDPGETPETAPPEQGSVETPQPAPDGCSPRDARPVIYQNTGAGYCLAFPARFEVAAADTLNVFINGLAAGEGPEPARATLNIIVEIGVEGKDLAQVVDEATREYQDLPLSRTPIALGSGPAVIVVGLPGRTGARQVFAIHGDRLYRLIFSPFDPAFPQVEADVQELWDAVLETFTFLEGES
jgi:hypothetical protein